MTLHDPGVAIRRFRYQFSFRSPTTDSLPRPHLPLLLSAPPSRDVFIWGLVDTGSDQAVFGAEMAAALGLDLRAGTRSFLDGVGGVMECWKHQIRIAVFDLRFRAGVAFVEHWPNEYGLVGISDVLSVLDVAISVSEQLVLAEPSAGATVT